MRLSVGSRPHLLWFLAGWASLAALPAHAESRLRFESSRTGLGFDIPADFDIAELELPGHGEGLTGALLIAGVPKGAGLSSVLHGESAFEVIVYRFDEPATLEALSSPGRAAAAAQIENLGATTVSGCPASVRNVLAPAGAPSWHEVLIACGHQGFRFSFPLGRAELAEEIVPSIWVGDRLEAEAGAGGEAPEQGGPTHFFYLVPSDRPYSGLYRAVTSDAIWNNLHWFRWAMPQRHTFLLADSEVGLRFTPHEAAWYGSNPNGADPEWWFWRNAIADAFDLTGGGWDDPGARWIYYLDADPACGQSIGGTSGVALLAANDLRGLAGEPNVPPCPGGPPDNGGPCRWVGGLAHEMGHAYLLPHPPDCVAHQPTCEAAALMWYGWLDFPQTYLRPLERSQLASSGFFRVQNPPPLGMLCPPPETGTPPDPPTDLEVFSSGFEILATWTDQSSNEQGFRVERSVDGGGWQEVTNLPANSTEFEETVPAPPPGQSGVYGYRVRAFNEAGYSAYSNTAYHEIFADPPAGRPTLLSPIGCASTQRPTFRWTAVDRARRYYLAVFRSADGALVVNETGLVGTSFTPEVDLQAGQEHYWMVKACNNVCTGWSDISLTTPFCPPTQAPLLIEPFGCTDTLRPALTWTEVPGATNYRIAVYQVVDVSNDVLLWYEDRPGTVFTPPVDLLPGQEYRFKVKAQNGPTFGPFSRHRYFTATCPLDTPPGTPSPLVPVGNVTTTRFPTFVWEAARRAEETDLFVCPLKGGGACRLWTADATTCSARQCAFMPPEPLEVGMHRYQLRARNFMGYGPWSGGEQLVVGDE